MASWWRTQLISLWWKSGYWSFLQSCIIYIRGCIQKLAYYPLYWCHLKTVIKVKTKVNDMTGPHTHVYTYSSLSWSYQCYASTLQLWRHHYNRNDCYLMWHSLLHLKGSQMSSWAQSSAASMTFGGLLSLCCWLTTDLCRQHEGRRKKEREREIERERERERERSRERERERERERTSIHHRTSSYNLFWTKINSLLQTHTCRLHIQHIVN